MPNYMGVVQRQKEPRSIADMAKANVEHVIVVGYIGRDPETRYSGNGKPITRGSLAVSWGKRGDPNQHTEWVSWTAWEREADIMARFGKGDAVLLIGKPSVREYNGKEYAELTVWSVATPIWRTDEKPDRGMPPIPPSDTKKTEMVDDDLDLPF